MIGVDKVDQFIMFDYIKPIVIKYRGIEEYSMKNIKYEWKKWIRLHDHTEEEDKSGRPIHIYEKI